MRLLRGSSSLFRFSHEQERGNQAAQRTRGHARFSGIATRIASMSRPGPHMISAIVVSGKKTSEYPSLLRMASAPPGTLSIACRVNRAIWTFAAEPWFS